MAFRSVLDIDVNDAKFKDFQKNFEKYQAAVGKLPAAWRKQDLGVQAVTASMADTAAALMAQNEMLSRSVRETDRLGRSAQGADRSFKSVLGTVTRISIAVAKWGALTALGGGLLSTLGIGGLASAGYGMKRSAGGLGTNIGRQRSFDLNYGQFVDSGFLGNVAGAQTDVSKRWAFGAMGVSGRGDPADVGASIVDAAHRSRAQLLSQTGEQYAKAHGFLEFASMEELKRIANSSGKDIAGARGSYGADAGRLNASADAWSNLNVQLRRTGMVLETSFMKALVSLTPGISRLSDSVSRAVESFLSNDKIKDWLDQAGNALERFAAYVGTSDFDQNVKSFVEGIGKVGRAIGWLVDKLPGGSGPAGPTGANSLGTAFPSVGIGVSRMGDKPVHNPLNLKSVGGKSWMQYGSDADGLNAAARQLRSYQNDRGINTIGGVVGRWTSGDDPRTVAAYIAAVSKRTGYAPDQKLNLNDDRVLVKVMDAMARQEGNGNVVITVLNNTGGNAIVSAAQLPQ